jgi:hypothetical protein
MTTIAKIKSPVAAWGFARDCGVAEPTRMIWPALRELAQVQRKGRSLVQTDNRKDYDSGITTPERISDDTTDKRSNIDPESIELWVC